MSIADIAGLNEALGRAFTDDPDVLQTYSFDHAQFSTAGKPLALVRAQTVEDVQTTVRFAHEHGVPIVPQGARTGLAGAANAIDGCILLSLERMNRVLDVNTVEQTCTVEPGIINGDLKRHLDSFDMSYPPDPGSVAISSIGGNVSTNAGGMCCVKYGVTADYVRSLKVVLPDGTLTTVGRPTKKGVAGYNLHSLIIGAEGTLGVVVEVTLELVPKLPPPLTAVAIFPDSVSAAGAVTDYMGTGGRPSFMEYMDRQVIEFVNAYGDFGLPDGAGAILLVQADGDGSTESAAAELERFTAVAKAVGADDVFFSDDPADSELLVAARRAVSPATQKFTHALGGGELVDDICVPRARLRDIFARLDEIAEQYPQLTFSCCAHAGDGNLHPTVTFNALDDEQVRLAEEAFGEIMRAGMECGGTITGEHGVGSLKAPWLRHELDEGSRAMHMAIKSAIDPKNIMNPGKMLQFLGEA